MSKKSQYLSGKDVIKKRMQQLGVSARDVLEKFIHAAGPGGQNVNKTATCVFLEHMATGIQVKCQQERTQSSNREKAWLLLLDKIQQRQESQQQAITQQLEREKRRHRKRPGHLKESILEAKRHLSEKKRLRRKIDLNRFD